MASDKSISVKVTGLAQLNRAFKMTDTELPKHMKAELLVVSTNVAEKVRGRVPRGKTGKAAGSVKARSTSSGASVVAGGQAAKYWPWLDWGGSTKRWPSGAIKRPFIKGDGRYLYKTIVEEGTNIKEAVDTAVKKVAEEAGFTTTGGIN